MLVVVLRTSVSQVRGQDILLMGRWAIP